MMVVLTWNCFQNAPSNSLSICVTSHRAAIVRTGIRYTTYLNIFVAYQNVIKKFAMFFVFILELYIFICSAFHCIASFVQEKSKILFVLQSVCHTVTIIVSQHIHIKSIKISSTKLLSYNWSFVLGEWTEKYFDATSIHSHWWSSRTMLNMYYVDISKCVAIIRDSPVHVTNRRAQNIGKGTLMCIMLRLFSLIESAH